MLLAVQIQAALDICSSNGGYLSVSEVLHCSCKDNIVLSFRFLAEHDIVRSALVKIFDGWFIENNRVGFQLLQDRVTGLYGGRPAGAGGGVMFKPERAASNRYALALMRSLHLDTERIFRFPYILFFLMLSCHWCHSFPAVTSSEIRRSTAVQYNQYR